MPSRAISAGSQVFADRPVSGIRQGDQKVSIGPSRSNYPRGHTYMNKSELVAAVADAAELSKTDAGKAIDALVEVIANALKNDDKVSLVGFGTFAIRARAERTGRNPKTGKTLKIAASKNPSFKAGKALKDAVK